MQLTSPDFVASGGMPVHCTCDGENRSPMLTIEGVPSDAESLALIMDDLDAPAGVSTHWSVWDIDPTIQSLSSRNLPQAANEGTDSFGSIGYFGHCPASGVHRYRFRIFALDAMLFLDSGARRDQLFAEIDGHLLAEPELIGLYQKGGM